MHEISGLNHLCACSPNSLPTSARIAAAAAGRVCVLSVECSRELAAGERRKLCDGASKSAAHYASFARPHTVPAPGTVYRRHGSWCSKAESRGVTSGFFGLLPPSVPGRGRGAQKAERSRIEISRTLGFVSSSAHGSCARNKDIPNYWNYCFQQLQTL